MFTWICPKCGGEVPPSYSECPRCAEAAGRRTAPPPVVASPPPVQPPPPVAPPPPVYAAPPPPPVYAAPPPPPVYAAPEPPAAPVYAAPPSPPAPASAPLPPQPQQTWEAPPPPAYVLPEPKKRMPAWLVVLLVFGVLGGGLYGVYHFFGSGSGSAGGGGETGAPVMASIAEEEGAHPFRRHLEVTGLRLFEDARKNVVLRYTVVNHSPAELGGVELRILLTTKNAGENAAALAEILAKVGTVPAHGAKEMESPVKTSLRAYELPDWQFLETRFSVTAPAN